MQHEARYDHALESPGILMFGKLSAIVYAPGQTPGFDKAEERRIDRYVEIYCGSGSGSGSGSGGCHGELVQQLEREINAELGTAPSAPDLPSAGTPS
jgi:hypothetical protein